MENITRILEGLNEEQSCAVKATQGPVLIVAGAGSGKTRVLTSRVAYLISEGADPSKILALTFTKKAAGEMKERIALIVGRRNASQVMMGTFHSVFVRILRDYADSLGYPRDFTIYDQSDSTAAIKTCIKELKLDDKTYKPRDVLSRISAAKNNLVLPSRYRLSQDLLQADLHRKTPQIFAIYELYQKKLKESGVMDFDDILVQMNILLRDVPSAEAEISARFSHIMVDEYQDTNYSQYVVLKRLAKPHRNICVVGDDSQSIYAFRGAKIENILNFRKDYPESRIIRLEKNYRSTNVIVEAANSVIAKNTGRIPKQCYSATGITGERIRIIESFSEQEEAALVVSALLEKMRMEKAQYRDFALLYRTNAQSRALEEVLRRRNLPYMIYSGNSFFDRAEVKDLMAWFKLVINPRDNESLKRIINKPARGIGDTTLSAVENYAVARQIPMFDALASPELALRGSAREKLKAFQTLVSSLHAAVPVTDALILAKRIADDSGLYASLKADNSIEGLSRTANVEELINSVASYIEEMEQEAAQNGQIAGTVTLDDFLEDVSLLSAVDSAEDEDDTNKIALMTVHSAKGLEFPYVFITGLEEELFPSGGFLASATDIEEERRLFYVALTRAKKAAWLSFAHTRMRNGQHNSNPPSRFIKEIDRKWLENPLKEESSGQTPKPSFGRFGRFGSGNNFPGAGVGRDPVIQRPVVSRPAPSFQRPPVIDPAFVPVPMSELYEGERIEHNHFGAGLILSIEGTAPDLKARISFDLYGDKTIMLKHAKLRPEKQK